MCKLDLLILSFFALYFKDSKECIGKLFKAIYSCLRMPTPALHDVVIKIFNETLQSLPHEASISAPFEPLSPSSSSQV